MPKPRRAEPARLSFFSGCNSTPTEIPDPPNVAELFSVIDEYVTVSTRAPVSGSILRTVRTRFSPVTMCSAVPTRSQLFTCIAPPNRTSFIAPRAVATEVVVTESVRIS